MDLIAELAKHNKKIEDITRVYSGLDNCCRCGCRGTYHDKGSRGFTRALNAIQKPDFKPLAENTEVYAPAHHGWVKSDGITYGGNYLNIPYDAQKDKCYCLYFE